MRILIGFLFCASLSLTVACGGGGGDTAVQPTSTPRASAPAAPTVSPSPSASPVPIPTLIPGTTKQNPLPIGTPATYSDGWEVTVMAGTPDATAQIIALDATNLPPDAGKQYFLATVQVRYLGAEPAIAFAAGYTLRSVGPSQQAYTFEHGCGVIPNPFPETEVGPGSTLTGNLCWEVPAADAAGLLLFYSPIAGTNVNRYYSDLTP